MGDGELGSMTTQMIPKERGKVSDLEFGHTTEWWFKFVKSSKFSTNLVRGVMKDEDKASRILLKKLRHRRERATPHLSTEVSKYIWIWVEPITRLRCKTSVKLDDHARSCKGKEGEGNQPSHDRHLPSEADPPVPAKFGGAILMAGQDCCLAPNSGHSLPIATSRVLNR